MCIRLWYVHSFSFTTVQVEEFRGVVDQEYFGWVAQYLVMKRVSIEPNFHTLYMNFLDALNEKQLFVVVLKETHRNIKVLGLHTPTQAPMHARMYACKHAHTHTHMYMQNYGRTYYATVLTVSLIPIQCIGDIEDRQVSQQLF